MIGKKIANEITKDLRISPQNSSETVTNEAEINEHAKEIPKERYTSPEKKDKIVDEVVM